MHQDEADTDTDRVILIIIASSGICRLVCISAILIFNTIIDIARSVPYTMYCLNLYFLSSLIIYSLLCIGLIVFTKTTNYLVKYLMFAHLMVYT